MAGLRRDEPLVVLVGPTGVGKTQLGIELCRELGGEIIGADSIQIYRELDVGSGKPTAAELDGVRHHLIDQLAPTEAIDAARYAALADAAIDEVLGRGAVPFVVGGTGLWLRALLRGLLELPPVDPALRAALEREWDEHGAALHARLAGVDPKTAARVHPSDRLRVVRALEVHAQTGRPLGELQEAHALGAPRYLALTLQLDVPPAHYRTLIEARIRDMLARGWVAEVQQLVARYGSQIKPLRSVGYRQLVLALEAGWDAAETERQLVRATRLYAKRQRNWFRSDPSVDLRVSTAEARSRAVHERIAAHLARRGP